MRALLSFLVVSVLWASGAKQDLIAQDLPPLPIIRSSIDEGWGVVLIQSLLNDRLAPQSRLRVDGLGGANTFNAVTAFQTKNGLNDDGIVGPDTWKKLFAEDDCRYMVRFHRPNWSVAQRESDSPIYECTVDVVRYDKAGHHLEKRFLGSIKIDYSASKRKRVGVQKALEEHGIVADGAYELTLGFHNRPSGSPTPKEGDLKPKSTGPLRPCLVVNRDQTVPCFSKKQGKKTSTGIHIHNGFATGRDSSGCPTIKSDQWTSFISLFLGRYGSLENWCRIDPVRYYGKSVGVLVIEKKQ